MSRGQGVRGCNEVIMTDRLGEARREVRRGGSGMEMKESEKQ